VAQTAKWLRPLESLIEDWHARWRPANADTRLTREWRGDREIVADTRGGSIIEHDVDSTGFEILEALAKPLSKKRLAKTLNGVSETSLDAQIERLHNQRLIFDEDGRYMNLLVESDRDQGYI
jgi:hypothetical protein